MIHLAATFRDEFSEEDGAEDGVRTLALRSEVSPLQHLWEGGRHVRVYGFRVSNHIPGTVGVRFLPSIPLKIHSAASETPPRKIGRNHVLPTSAVRRIVDHRTQHTREAEDMVRLLVTETLLTFTKTKEGRAKLREVHIYPTLREAHSAETSPEVKDAIEQLVGFVISDEGPPPEAGPGPKVELENHLTPGMSEPLAPPKREELHFQYDQDGKMIHNASQQLDTLHLGTENRFEEVENLDDIMD